MCSVSLRIDVVRDAETAASIPIPEIIRTYYPGFDTWFDRTVLPSLGKDRAILLARTDDGLAGFCVLKENFVGTEVFALYAFTRAFGIEESVPLWSNMRWVCCASSFLW